MHMHASIASVLNVKNSPDFVSAFFVPLLSSSVAHVVRFTKAKGQGLIAFLRVLVAMDVTKEILPLEKIFGGVSKCLHEACA